MTFCNPFRSAGLTTAALLTLTLAALPAAPTCADQSFILSAEPGAHRVRRINADGSFHSFFIYGDPATFTPNHLCVGPDRERLYIPTYLGTSSVLVFDVDTGAALGEIDHAAFVSPAWTGLAPNGDLIISDFDGGRVYRYDLNTQTFVGELVEHGHLLTAHSVVFNDNGSILVLDWYGGQIVRYHADGSFDRILSNGPALLGPLDMLPSPDGTELYVTNNSLNNIARFDRSTGASLGELVSTASGLLANPEGMIYDRNGTIVAVSPGSGRVQRFDATTGDFMGLAYAGSGWPVDLVLVEASCPGDIDNNGSVGLSDVINVLASWGTCDSPCPTDLDASGATGLGDLLAVLASWGDCE